MITINKSSSLHISVPKQCPSLISLGKTLGSLIEKSVGCSWSVNDGTEPDIILDIAPFAESVFQSKVLPDECFLTEERNGSLFLLGNDEKALTYAVYDFGETFLDCVYMTADEDYIPKKNAVTVESGYSKEDRPLMNYREVYYHNAWHDTLGDKWKLNGDCNHPNSDPQWGLFCHSFFDIIPPAQYFESHPEYFSMHGGKRTNYSQLCCSNDEMIDQAIENLRVMMNNKPSAHYWSVSQNDGGSPCECEKCQKLDKDAGSPFGSIAYFVNRVAKAFPDKTISTLAYWYSTKAPQNVVLEDNVSVLLCAFEVDRHIPIAKQTINEGFYKNLTEWKHLCKRLFVWDYCVQFSTLIAPYPNFHVLAPNLQFFYECGVRYMYAQGNRERVGEFSALRAYLLAKLLWDPYCDIEMHKKRFIAAYYGKASPYVTSYLNALQDNLISSGEPLSMYGKPERESFLSRENLDTYLGWIRTAMEQVKNDPVILARVEEIYMSLLFVKIKTKRYDKAEEHQIFSDFKRTAKSSGCEKVDEVRITADMFIEGYETGNMPEDTVYAFS